MAGNPHILVCVAAPFTVAALLCIAISFATESWQHIDINHLPYNGTEEYHFSRRRGLFRTCFDSKDTDFLMNSKYSERVTDSTCLKDKGLPFDGPDSNDTNDVTRGHVLRLLIALLAISILLLLIGAFLGGFGCLKNRGKLLTATAVLNFISGLLGAIGAALFHIVIYFEGKINLDPYPGNWTQSIVGLTDTKLHYSYILCWVGSGLAIIAGIFYAIAGRETTRKKNKEKKLMAYQQPGPYPIANAGYEQYPPNREYGYPNAPPTVAYDYSQSPY